jgi:Flp pilus assembly protein TadG
VRDEAGSILVAGVVAILVFVILGAGVIEVGRWFEHRRNLQVRTDAAALAAGQAMNACFNIGSPAFPNEQAADTFIENWAKTYGGLASPVGTQTGAPYNRGFGSDPFMTFRRNAFPTSASPTGTPDMSPECFKADGTPNFTVDVKTTQQGLSPFFKWLPFPHLHGWARVELQVVKALKPTMPLAVPDVNPKHVAVTFVKSDGSALTCSGAPLGTCTFPLDPPVSVGTLNNWGGQATVPVPATGGEIRMRVSIGASNGNCTNVTKTATYTCYDYGGTSTGLLSVRSYSTAAVPANGTAPVLRSVTPVTCLQANLPGGTPYFSKYQVPGGTCDNVGVKAVVEFPSGAKSSPAPKVTYAIVLHGKQCNPNGQMSQSGTTWSSTLSSFAFNTGLYDICLGYSFKDSGNTTRTDSFNNGNPVQQIYSAGDGSDPGGLGGPIAATSLVNTADNSPGYSLAAGAPTATLGVTIGLTGGVHVNPKCFNGTSGTGYTCASDPTVILRTASTSGSLNFAINCGAPAKQPGDSGNSPLYLMIKHGCLNSFSINQADLCPDPTIPAPDPTSCAPVQQVTGDKVGPVRDAMHDRFVDATTGKCATNHYPDTSTPGDPRVMRLIDTDFSAYLGQNGGATEVPVVTFATFYITGWTPKNNDTSCAQENEPAPPGSDPNSADIWGHFITYDTDGTPSGFKCAADSAAPCVPALVR